MLDLDFTVLLCERFRMHTDPRDFIIPKQYTTDAPAFCYEFEFYPEDWEGGRIIDGILYPSKKNSYSLCKPGAIRRKVMPYRGYLLSIQTHDPQLKAALDYLPVCGTPPQMEEILEIARKISLLSSSTTPEIKLKRISYVSMILSLLLENQNITAQAEQRNTRRHQQALANADQYLRDHLTEKLDLTQLAKESGLTPTYFHKLFTSTFGRTPAQQLLWYRTLQAFRYLRDDDCPLSEVASKCGFSSQSYFCYIFKQYCGETPSQYRNRLRKEEGSR